MGRIAGGTSGWVTGYRACAKQLPPGTPARPVAWRTGIAYRNDGGARTVSPATPAPDRHGRRSMGDTGKGRGAEEVTNP
jgi:hypothetical protein